MSYTILYRCHTIDEKGRHGELRKTYEIVDDTLELEEQSKRKSYQDFLKLQERKDLYLEDGIYIEYIDEYLSVHRYENVPDDVKESLLKPKSYLNPKVYIDGKNYLVIEYKTTNGD